MQIITEKSLKTYYDKKEHWERKDKIHKYLLKTVINTLFVRCNLFTRNFNVFWREIENYSKYFFIMFNIF